MKNNIKIILAFMIGGLIFGSIGTVLALTYQASDIVYSPSDTSWNVSTVGEAINSLALSKTSDNYSEEERVVGTWIDGKPIYQKTIVKNNNSYGANSVISFATIEDIENLIYQDGFADIASNTQIVFGSKNILAWKERNTINIQSVNSIVGRIALTLRYTKTTD